MVLAHQFLKRTAVSFSVLALINTMSLPLLHMDLTSQAHAKKSLTDVSLPASSPLSSLPAEARRAFRIDPSAPEFNRNTHKTAYSPATRLNRSPELYHMQQTADESMFGQSQMNADDMPPTSTLQGNLTSIKVIRGRSQIIKFAQPVSRISIANPQIADIIPLAPDQIMINGKSRGVTSLIVWDDDGQEGVFDLYVENDSSELVKAIESIAPNERIAVRVTDDSFILSGQVSNSVILDEIRQTAYAYGYREDKFIDLTETPVPQVVLEVKIAEANRSVARALKTSFSLDIGNSFSLTRLANLFDDGLGQTLPAALLNASPFPAVGAGTRTTAGLIPSRPIGLLQQGTNVGGLTGAGLGLSPSSPFGAAWDFLETTGKVTVLAEPTLVCTHGRSANFLAGGEFPFVGSVDANGSPIVQFKEFGVKLDFTPWISIRSGRVELRVAPEVSSLDSSNCVAGAGGTQVCGILKRTTDTTVELQDGESLMIAGILTREEQNTMQKVPFVADLPVIGNFFKNANTTKSDRELIVVVTPRIVKPGHYGKILGKQL